MKNLSTLNSTYTVQVEDKDHYSWHQGIENYGFWAVIIRDKAWLEAFHKAKKHISPFVLSNYQRTPHITLSACGLIDERFFSNGKLKKQIKALDELELKSFYIEQDCLDSFESAPYISIKPNPSLNLIRETLGHIHRDNPAEVYHPHLTLGFYNLAHPFALIKQHLAKHQLGKLSPLHIDRITYCHYQTCNIQGELNIKFELTLS